MHLRQAPLELALLLAAGAKRAYRNSYVVGRARDLFGGVAASSVRCARGCYNCMGMLVVFIRRPAMPKSLDLSSCANVTDRGLAIVGSKCPRLQILRLGLLYNIGAEVR